MVENMKKYEDLVENIMKRAHAMRSTLLDPIVEGNGTFIKDAKVRQERLTNALKNTVFESAGESAPMIVGAASRALQNYITTYNRMPSDELLASVHNATENVFELARNPKLAGGVFESADMSTTEGIMMRDRMIALILPVVLQQVTSQMVTLMPGQFNQSEIFRIHRVAGSTFGDLSKGDRIDQNYNGRYAVMDQMSEPMVGDGSKTTFTLAAKTPAMPVKGKRVKILHDRNIVAIDDGVGHIMGVFEIASGTTKTAVNVTGTVDYATGKVDATFSVAPAAGVQIHIGYDVDIEKDPSLIPLVDHQMDSRVVYPHESAIGGNVTVQALWALRREFGLDADNMAMSAMRNILAADKDRKILRDLYFYARDEVTWNRVGSEHYRLAEHYETLNAALLEMDTRMMLNNGFSGLVGLVGDPCAVNIFRYMSPDYFQPAPGYRSLPQPHYVGRIFNQFDLYCDPHQEQYTCLGFGRGTEYGRTAYLAGDAVPALTFRHPVMNNLRNSSTLWDLSYRDLQPFDGRDYLMKLRMVDDSTSNAGNDNTGKTENAGNGDTGNDG